MIKFIFVAIICILFSGSNNAVRLVVSEPIPPQQSQIASEYNSFTQNNIDRWLQQNIPFVAYKIIKTAIYPVLWPEKAATEWRNYLKNIHFSNPSLQTATNYLGYALNKYVILLGFSGIWFWFAKRMFFGIVRAVI